MTTMGPAESVIDNDIREVGKLLRKARIVFLLFWMETQIFQ